MPEPTTPNREVGIRVKRAVRHVETLSRETVNVTPLPGFRGAVAPHTPTWPIVVNAEPTGSSSTEGLYPSYVYFWDGVNWTPEDCYTSTPEGFSLKVGQHLMGVLIGEAEDGVLIFGVAGDDQPATSEAYLTTSFGSPAKWKFVPIEMISGVEVPGAETPDFCASPFSIDGVNTCVPQKCLRVRVWATGEVIGGVPQFAFAPSPRGMPVETTDVYNPLTGFPWKLLVLTTGVGFGDYSPAITGANAYTVDGLTSLPPGTRGVLHPTPTTNEEGDCSVEPGWIFTPVPSAVLSLETEAYLTTSDGEDPPKWKFIPIVMEDGTETLGTETAEFCASSFTIDGVNTCVPMKCLRVRVRPTEIVASVQYYSFEPVPRGMPVELTDDLGDDGWAWKLLYLDLSLPAFIPYTPAITGSRAFNANYPITELKVGMRGTLHPTPTKNEEEDGGCSIVEGWLFIPDLVIGDCLKYADDGTLTVDLETDDARTTIENIVEDTWISIVPATGKLRQTKRLRTYWNYYNACGLPIAREPGDAFEEYTDVNLCGSGPCCTATTLTTNVIVTNPSPCTFHFATTVSGGTASFYYSWKFGDGGVSDVQNPTHTYLAAGTYNWKLVVTDDCGQRYERGGTVTCEVQDPPVGPFCDTYTVAGVTLTRVGGGGNPTWTGGGFTLANDGNFGVTTNWTLHYDPVGDDDCTWVPWTAGGDWDGSSCVDFLLVDCGRIPHVCETCPRFIEVCCGGTPVTNDCCPDVDIPPTVRLTFSGGTGDLAGLNGRTINLTYAASGTTCNASSYTGWYTEFAFSGKTLAIVFRCMVSTWSVLTQQCDGPGVGGSNATDVSCDPDDFGVAGTGIMWSGTFTGTVDWTVTF